MDDHSTDLYYQQADDLPKARAAVGKIRPGLIPAHALTEVAKTFTINAAKHGDLTYLDADPSLYEEAHHRHTLATMRGEEIDDEGLLHWAAIACNALIVLEHKLGYGNY